ncbi:hypothetical protein RJ639_024192 [Escallonia herrerae]|uniref:Cation/H+ exchanger domain-containing protein n=1 Tax=Escallonia herrerae TaxID=1293975 RepID=A0AA88V1I8_9ASTE|nr:hypothetical protein RJ639_024192 [Escallonia herrerae]
MSTNATIGPSPPQTNAQTAGFLCVRFPPKVHSTGLFGKGKSEWFTYTVPTLEMQMLLIFSVTQILHLPLKRLGIPKLLSELLAGVILGSTFLGRYNHYQGTVFSLESQGVIGPIAAFGYMLFMFLSGAKMDVSMIRKTGTKAWGIGVLNVIAPLVCGFFYVRITEGTLGWGRRMKDARVQNLPTLVIANSVTAFPVIALLLKDLKLLNSELGRLALSSTLISYLLGTGITVLGNVIDIGQQHSVGRAVVDLVLCVLFLAVTIYIVRPAMIWVAKQTPEGRPVKDFYTYLIILGVMVSSVFSHYFEQTAIFGPFIMGLAVPEGPPLGSALVDKLESFAYGVFLPLFVSLNALRTNLMAIDLKKKNAGRNKNLMAVTSAAKLLGCFLPALYCNMPLNDAVSLSFIMIAKGVVDLASYSFLRDNNTVSANSYAVLVVATIMNAITVPIVVKWLYEPSRKYAGYQNRNIMHSKQTSKLPVLACIHRPDNIAAVLKLLEASSPSSEYPLAVYVLHLIELRGRASPVFISHQLQTRTVANVSYSENVILAFSQYERNNWGAVMVQAFTAISPRKLMHEDICTLALDTLASIIIIPFHRQWGIDGSVEAEDPGLRTLNRSVIDRAPCSIGILVDRGHLKRSNSIGMSEKSYSVAMIFIGGKDDQEALIFAKRMARNPSITLTVVHLASTVVDQASNEKDKIIDAEVLNDVKHNVGHSYIRYVEEEVKDGSESALILRDMVHQYDLIIVGRRYNVPAPQTVGLGDWNEDGELGLLGDLLASSDLKCRASVLVVQQQQK